MSSYLVCLFVCQSVSPLLHIVCFGPPLHYPDRLASLINTIPYFFWTFRVYFCEATNANLDSGCRTVSIVTGDKGSWWSHLANFVGHSIGVLVCFFVDCGHNERILFVTKLRHADKCFVNTMKEYIERNNLQLELVKKMLTLFTFTFAKRWKFRTQTTSAPFLTV